MGLTSETEGRLSHGGVRVLHVLGALLSPAPVLCQLDRAQGHGHVTEPHSFQSSPSCQTSPRPPAGPEASLLLAAGRGEGPKEPLGVVLLRTGTRVQLQAVGSGLQQGGWGTAAEPEGAGSALAQPGPSPTCRSSTSAASAPGASAPST